MFPVRLFWNRQKNRIPLQQNRKGGSGEAADTGIYARRMPAGPRRHAMNPETPNIPDDWGAVMQTIMDIAAKSRDGITFNIRDKKDAVHELSAELSKEGVVKFFDKTVSGKKEITKEAFSRILKESKALAKNAKHIAEVIEKGLSATNPVTLAAEAAKEAVKVAGKVVGKLNDTFKAGADR